MELKRRQGESFTAQLLPPQAQLLVFLGAAHIKPLPSTCVVAEPHMVADPSQDQQVRNVGDVFRLEPYMVWHGGCAFIRPSDCIVDQTATSLLFQHASSLRMELARPGQIYWHIY